MNEERLKFRMYFFVPYNISPIQQAIQAGHAALEYAIRYGKSQSFLDFASYDKTWIILNGGTTNDHLTQDKDGKIIYKGTLNEILNELGKTEMQYSFFREPDLNEALTAVCFLADERVWDYETYPDFIDFYTNLFPDDMTPPKRIELRLKTEEELKQFPYYDHWVESLGGSQNVFLRQLLKGKKLA